MGKSKVIIKEYKKLRRLVKTANVRDEAALTIKKSCSTMHYTTLSTDLYCTFSRIVIYQEEKCTE